MDPYLEHPARWPGFHNWLMTYIADDLSPRVRPRYFVALEERVYVADLPDVVRIPDAVVLAADRHPPANGPQRTSAANGAASRSGTQILVATVPAPQRIREAYLEIHETATGDVVTQIELLSPTNKSPGKGRQEYLEKRLEILGTRTSLVEIDLLRAGEPMPSRIRDWPPDEPLPGDYRILIARGRRRPLADIYAFGLRDPLPEFPVPLLREDEEPLVDLQELVHRLYDRASYDLRLDYRQETTPPLSPADAEWADHLLRERDLR
jgi:hypothetical protein